MREYVETHTGPRVKQLVGSEVAGCHRQLGSG